MRRELGNEETEEREFITIEIDEVKFSPRSFWTKTIILYHSMLVVYCSLKVCLDLVL